MPPDLLSSPTFYGPFPVLSYVAAGHFPRLSSSAPIAPESVSPAAATESASVWSERPVHVPLQVPSTSVLIEPGCSMPSSRFPHMTSRTLLLIHVVPWLPIGIPPVSS